MRIHHLNCGSHCPVGGRFYDNAATGLMANICTHCLLIEIADRLVLVDTGYGLADVRNAPERRLSRLWPLVLNPNLKEEDTALRQVEALGYSARDVRHIVLTHLDFDHAGGLEDFPDARVHLLAAEQEAARHMPRSFVGNQRYRPLQWDGVRDWRTYAPAGEPWFGFEAVRELEGLPPEILIVPLSGHTRGHAGVATQTTAGWLLDAGDAYLHHSEIDTGRGMPPGLAIYERIMMTDPPAARHNLGRLRELRRAHGTEVEIFCSHDTGELQALQARS
ncbi:MBL fold metallo-hydrolase [Mesorhizobium escarrei]|uniref:MBL fold metallo-hydrolase n=1 Tax=Mesorhizobium escarrei TaxID=666018 RepID=A0ABM9EIM9_9HYPH|nr:MBL fold metallo-hydrolase [Mesorhizobium escarrei]CAH2408787.1 MBL fold metallo-hydrolase [Mesorhizobium escarrei]